MKSFLEPTESGFGQLVRFAAAGLLNTAVDFAVTAVFLGIFTFHYGYIPASCIGFLAGVVLSYVLSVRWIFTVRSVSDRRLEFMLFLVIGIIGLVLHAWLLYVMVDTSPAKEMVMTLTRKLDFIFKMEEPDVWFSKIAVTVIVFFWNFYARKCILFRSK
ncbi:MAG: GtrA family protein [Abditibacteriota bacterium]|nr:GtrA family protein [Abditibacteriota bacterium]